MKIKTSKTITVTMELDELEARWLKELVQNPLIDKQFCDEESQRDTTMREIFFKALNEAGV
jgi:hypothetical protein